MTDTNPSDPGGRTTGKSVPANPVSLTIDPASVSRLLELLRETLRSELQQALATTPVLPQPVPSSQPSEPAPAPKSTGLDLKAADRLKAADLRIALLMGKIPEDAGLLIDTKVLAKLLDVSKATLYRLQAEEAIPAPVQLGNLKKWRLGEILEWIEADCPPLRVWVHKRQDASKRKGK
jgi:predicted DNA-binding transcriptional regulator AlpA